MRLTILLLCTISLCRIGEVLDLAFVSSSSPRQQTASRFASLQGFQIENRVSSPVASPTGAFKPGQILHGKVKKVIDTGLVVQVAPRQTGFVHVSELRDGYVNHPGEHWRVDAEITVSVLRHDPDFLKLSVRKVGKKALLSDFLVGQKVQGVVKGTTKHGAYVNIGATRDAYLPNRNIKLPRDEGSDDSIVQDARNHLQAGDRITAWVRTKEKPRAPGAEGSLKLTMRQSESVYAARILTGLRIASLKEGQELGGYVRGVRDKVCFVSVGAEVDGVLRMRNINDGIVVDMHKLMKVGDMVAVRVRRIRIEEKKLELELVNPPKRLPALGRLAPLEGKNVWLEGIVSGKADETWRQNLGRDGYVVDVKSPDDKLVTGLLVHGEAADAKSETQLEVGDKISVRILQVDDAKKQIFFSARSFDLS